MGSSDTIYLLTPEAHLQGSNNAISDLNYEEGSWNLAFLATTVCISLNIIALNRLQKVNIPIPPALPLGTKVLFSLELVL